MGELAALDVILVVALLGCFLGAAVLAVAEVSLLRVRRSRVRVEANDGDPRARDLLVLLEDLPLSLNSVLLLVLLCQVGAATISGFLAQRWAGGAWITAVSVVITLLLFVYAEAVPKTLAMRAPHARALRAAPWLRHLVRLCRPVVAALVALSDLQAPGQASADPVSERELRLLARQSAEAGTIDIDDADLVDRSFLFGDTTVADVMVPRERIVAVAADAEVPEALAVAIAAGHRRLPVHGGEIDDIIGVVRLRDLAAASRHPTVGVTDVMRPPLFCRAADSIPRLLKRMRSSGMWLAIVRDDQATTIGLVTVEDVVAELMGEIDEPDPLRF